MDISYNKRSVFSVLFTKKKENRKQKKEKDIEWVFLPNLSEKLSFEKAYFSCCWLYRQ